MTFRSARGDTPVNIFSVKIAALGSLKGLLEGFLKLESNFKEASENL